MNNNKGITHILHQLLWMSCRYAIGRSSIASQGLPCDIVREYYNEMTEDQRQSLANDIMREVASSQAFHHIDLKSHDYGDIYDVWIKFASALDNSRHITVHVNQDNSDHICFKYNGEYYPLDRYIANPYVKCIIPVELISL